VAVAEAVAAEATAAATAALSRADDANKAAKQALAKPAWDKSGSGAFDSVFYFLFLFYVNYSITLAFCQSLLALHLLSNTHSFSLFSSLSSFDSCGGACCVSARDRRGRTAMSIITGISSKTLTQSLFFSFYFPFLLRLI
jgi:hypothetical protein